MTNPLDKYFIQQLKEFRKKKLMDQLARMRIRIMSLRRHCVFLVVTKVS